MARSFLGATTLSLRFAFLGFCIGLSGVALGFAGFGIGWRWLSVFGYAVVAIGILIGLISILSGWVLHGRAAIVGGIKSVANMRNLYQLLTRDKSTNGEHRQ